MTHPESDNRRVVITGGPGSGKTSLIEKLAECGYRVFPEYYRDHLTDPLNAANKAEKPSFSRIPELIFRERVKAHQAVSNQNLAFYDRALPDSLAYIRFLGRETPAGLIAAIHKYRYHREVFMAPPWKEIYRNDGVRSETFEEACLLHRMLVEVYEDCGYRMVEIPKDSLQNRVKFLLSFLNEPIVPQSDI